MTERKKYNSSSLLARIAIVLGISSAALLLASCNSQQNEAYLISHPSELSDILTHCQSTMEKQHSAIDPECIQAKQAYARLIDLITHFETDGQEGFGKMIMATESQIADLNTRLEQAPRNLKSQIRQQINQQWQKVYEMWAVKVVVDTNSAGLRQLFQAYPPGLFSPPPAP